MTKDALPYVLKKEIEMVAHVRKSDQRTVSRMGSCHLTEKQISLVSHNIFVQGQCGYFEDGHCINIIHLEEYVELQTELLIQNVSGSAKVH